MGLLARPGPLCGSDLYMGLPIAAGGGREGRHRRPVCLLTPASWPHHPSRMSSLVCRSDSLLRRIVFGPPCKGAYLGLDSHGEARQRDGRRQQQAATEANLRLLTPPLDHPLRCVLEAFLSLRPRPNREGRDRHRLRVLVQPGPHSAGCQEGLRRGGGSRRRGRE